MTYIWRIGRYLGLAAVALSAASISVHAQEGTMRVGMGVDVNTLDPTQTRVLTDLEVIKHVLETLVSTDEGQGPQPLLATGWSVADDGVTWTFNLREGVTFHDGTPFNAEAVKFNIDRFTDPETGTLFSSLLEMVEETTVVDEYTVEIVTEYPFSPLLLHLAYPATALSSPSAIEKFGDEYSSNPVGTGPFKFAERRSGQYTELEVNTDYWGELPGIARLRYIPIVEASTRIAALEAGDIDIAVRIPYHEVERLEGVAGTEVVRSDSSRIMFMPMNVSRAPLDDPRVRKALNHAVDKEAIAEAILLGNGRPMDAIIGPGAFGYSEVATYEYDPDKARALLEEAGVDNLQLDFYYSPGRYTADSEVAEAVVSFLEAVGITVAMHRMEWSTYLEAIRDGDSHHLSLYGWGWASGDAHQGLTALFSEGSASNAAHYARQEVEELLAAQAAEADPDERARIIHEVSEILMEDAPWIFLVSQGLVTGMRDNVDGVLIPANEMLNFYQARFVD